MHVSLKYVTVIYYNVYELNNTGIFDLVYVEWYARTRNLWLHLVSVSLSLPLPPPLSLSHTHTENCVNVRDNFYFKNEVIDIN